MTGATCWPRSWTASTEPRQRSANMDGSPSRELEEEIFQRYENKEYTKTFTHSQLNEQINNSGFY